MATEESESGVGWEPQQHELPEDAPAPEEIDDCFRVTDVRVDGDRYYYFGHAMVSTDRLTSELWPRFDEAGFDVRHREETGEEVLVARRSSVGIDGIPWTNVVLFVLTLGSTLWAGSLWFHADPADGLSGLLVGWPFAVGILTVLGVHELGHYVMTRYHGVDATLPYFIPVPTLIGTMGAVIRMKGRMPNRRALFDIGIAGPLAGLVATVVVTVIGLHLEPVTAPAGVMERDDVYQIAIGFPPLLEFLAWATGEQLYYQDPRTSVHPVVIAGWVGTFVTFLNLIPVGQLDGGHVVRSMLPNYQQAVGWVVPGLLYALAGYLVLVRDVAPHNALLWLVWGTVALLVAKIGPATPANDDADLGRGRKALALVTFLIGLACFAPVPIAIFP